MHTSVFLLCGANECLVFLFYVLFLAFLVFWRCLFLGVARFGCFGFACCGSFSCVEAFKSLCYGQLHLRVGVPHLLRWSLGFLFRNLSFLLLFVFSRGQFLELRFLKERLRMHA